ncbi:uncharacterized protein EV420DRAFT_1128381 [Desarmillaria tabescens]|uniref:Uncharacterized protein n=1 Tax=Armillaria tabescens TaxID=1929756 RepID=A0AA39JDM7_ARMTA|nr:uncharacterized protein EV420DRAFT_1128381 [Desarmillaria tabescens]KAK0440856.1 hypothetical protein EV420DRAFT_1128381 [Desarmillaria tabescens]
MLTEKEIDFRVPNHRLYTGSSDLPFGWSCAWHSFCGRYNLYPCVRGRIDSNLILEALFNVHGDIFFVMYKSRTFLTVIRTGEDPTQYYFFNLYTERLIKLTEHYPTVEAFMERARLWEGGDAQINSVTPFQVLEITPGPRDISDLSIEWQADVRALA